MSEQAAEREVIELPHNGDLAFGALMDALAPEEGAEAGSGEGAAAGAAGTPAPVPADGGAGSDGGGAESAGQPPAVADGSAAPAATGAAGGAEGAAAGSAAADEGQPSGGDAEAVRAAAIDPKLIDQLGTISTTIETNISRAFQQEAYDVVKGEHPQYFEALAKHPRLLVGTQVPAIGREGMETLRDSADAAEWQEAVKTILMEEINSRAETKVEESRAYLETIHGAVDLFKNNKDLIPGTPGFDRGLADAFAEMAKPYEVRVDDKLSGYSIPVQPIIDALRKQRASVPAPAAPEPPAGAPEPVRPAANVEPPQAGIPSKAGNSSEKEDFSTLFGTIGLPNLQI